MSDVVFKMKECQTFHPFIIALFFVFTIVFCMFSMNPVYLMLSLLMGIIVNIKLNSLIQLKKIIAFIIFFIVISIIINGLFVHQGFTILFFMNDNPITLEALVYGLSFALMISATLIWFNNLSLVMDTDKVVYLLGRFSPLLAFIISLVLRYIPYLQNYYKKINDINKVNYHDQNKALLKKLGRSISSFLALLTFVFENSLDTVNAINALGYGSKRRTSFHLYHFEKRDLWALIIIVAFFGLSIFLYYDTKQVFYYYPSISTVKLDLLSIIGYLSYFIYLLLPLGFEKEEELRWKLSISKI